MNDYKPPFEITSTVIDLLVKIGSELSRLEISAGISLTPRLRRVNQIKTIQASLAIEQNTLTLEQVTAVIDGTPVKGLPNEITEVKNAYLVYGQIDKFNPHSPDDLLKAHEFLMNGLIDSAGSWRTGAVGIVKGREVVHMAPPAERVPYLMAELLSWLKQTDTHPLIASSVVHYELEFIHPFADGNGRMGRLWQSVILTQWNTVFSWLPVETIVRKYQQEYYSVLAACDKLGDSTKFIEFMLRALLETCGGVNGGVSGGVKSLDEQIFHLLESSEIPLRANNMVMQLNASQRTVERAIQRLKKNNRIIFKGAPKTGGYIVIEG